MRSPKYYVNISFSDHFLCQISLLFYMYACLNAIESFMKLTTFVTNVFKIAMGQGLVWANTPALFWCKNILNLNESSSNLVRKYEVERIFCVYCCCLSSSWSAILVRVLSFVKYLLNYSCVLEHLFRYINFGKVLSRGASFSTYFLGY